LADDNDLSCLGPRAVHLDGPTAGPSPKTMIRPAEKAVPKEESSNSLVLVWRLLAHNDSFVSCAQKNESGMLG